jgi:hypothetical protein
MASGQGVVEHYSLVLERASKQLCAAADPGFTPLN